jgi:hypothetical protein
MSRPRSDCVRNGEARFAELWEEGRSLEVGDAISAAYVATSAPDLPP